MTNTIFVRQLKTMLTWLGIRNFTIGKRQIFQILLSLVVIMTVNASRCDADDESCVQEITDRPIIVVGSGLAGLSASIEAYNAGANVVLVEKEPRVGGNSAKATSGINGAASKYQKNAEIDDSVGTFKKDTLSSGDGLCVESLVDLLANNSASAIDWVSSFGVELSNIVFMGGHSQQRTHREPARPDGKPSPVGFNIVSALRKHAESLVGDKFAIKTGTKVERVITTKAGEDIVASGVQVSDSDGNREELIGTIVLATGGYGNDHTDSSLLQEFKPEVANLPTTNGPFATGEGVKMGRAIGAQLMHMDKVQIHPTGFIEVTDPNSASKFLAPEALRGSGGILLNSEGKRFTNELGRRDDVTAAIFAQKTTLKGVDNSPSVAYMLLNEDMCDKFGQPNLGFYKFKKLVRPVESLKDLAEEMGADVETLKETLSNYGKDADPFGKKVIPYTFNADSDKLWVAVITPAIHYTMGGLSINTQANIMADGSNRPIKGLYGAGEVTAGVHGGNRLGGNSLLECVVFGRIAGKSAATYTQDTLASARELDEPTE
ncbi:hypothetical protein SARC_07182 [Sphaeroforma arctica JP610]|uniref:fumarate reductase (NADH) n=1 Tax=Sphaeroforma arctica JP610 TaxID=667725 RepID=A0A0L0FUF0_9EUKA|nr:hypothetical protein SARC_07182 [Sphaeroforma arctica JP610]KNC80457.1 hypothetical protein SARC_07182 [Sphaeroforma arctica JP610]|eukprot:XP_014154359.1 hypothetical protein SARC_07182 [Sphaeroforma arctica JP610]